MDKRSWEPRPLTAFDVETTGIDCDMDRIITAALVHIEPESSRARTTVINPGVAVPEEAADLHGWTTERVQAEGKPPASELDWIAGELADSLADGTPLVVANAPFDLTLLDRELRRHRLPTVWDRLNDDAFAPVIDPMVLDKRIDTYRRGKRTLTDLCGTYGLQIQNAHDSAADAYAAAGLVQCLHQLTRLPENQLVTAYRERRSPQLVADRLRALGDLTLDQLHQAQIGWYREDKHSLADYFRRQASQQDDPAEAQRLHQRASSVDTVWPVRHFGV